MQLNASPAEAGFAALQAGRNGDAVQLLQQALAREPRQITLHLGLAHARLGLGDEAGAEAAIDAGLAVDSRNVRALLFKADRLNVRGKPTAAGPYYNAALRSAQTAAQIPSDLRPELARAAQELQTIADAHERDVLARLKAAGVEDPYQSPQFGASLGILFGKRAIHVQEPRAYYFPGLAQREFFERREFAWTEAIEARTEEIAADLNAEMGAEDRFSAYVEGDDRPHADHHGMVGNTDWGALYLWRDGAAQADALGRHAAAADALGAAPLCDIPGASPSVLFSRLRAGAAIPPHNGLINVRLICHLPLITPGDGALRVGGETRAWTRGELLIFDDTIEHEAWNRSQQDRVVLLFDVWRPELSEEERAMVRALLAGFDTQGD